MKATIFGIPVGIAILAGVVAIGVALAATDNIPGLAEGGIVTGPIMAHIGEGGAAETVIPLNDRGAKFMQSAMGMGGNGEQHIHLYIDGKKMTEKVIKHMPSGHPYQAGICMRPKKSTPAQPPALTPQEQQLLQSIWDGHSIAQTADLFEVGLRAAESARKCPQVQVWGTESCLGRHYGMGW